MQNYFEFITKKHGTLTENPPVQTYVNRIKNRIVLKIKTGYNLEFLISETMRLLGSTKKDFDKDNDKENVQKLEFLEIILVYCNLIKTDYQHTSKVLFTFVPNKQFGQLINISPHSLTTMNIVNTDFPLFKFGLQTNLVNHLKLKTMSI